MKAKIRRIIALNKSKTIITENLLNTIRQDSTLNRDGAVLTQIEFQRVLLELVDEGVVKPMNVKETWGYNKAITKKYKIVREEEKMSGNEVVEIMTKYHPSMIMNYYYTRENQYALDEKYLKQLSAFLYRKVKDQGMATNERSVDVFEDEKYLHSKGKSLLKRAGLSFDVMNCYDTTEPFMYFAVFEAKVKNVLVIENKDTYDSFVKLLVEGNTTYFGIDFQMVIYGEGNKSPSSLGYLSALRLDDVEIYYYGDFDRSGFQIYASLLKNYGEKYNIQLFKPMYEKLWTLRLEVPQKNEQNVQREIYVKLLEGFSNKEDMIAYLDKHFYIPQECTNIVLLRELSLNGNQ